MKLMTLLFLSSAVYASQWYTASSLTVGTKSASNLPQSFEVRIEQYFIYDALPKVYYKAGYFHEQLKIWGSDVDTAENILVGLGYNIIDYKGIFVDLGLSGAYRFSYDTQSYQSTYVEYNDPAVIPYGEIGVGYSFYQITVRMDILMGLLGQGEAVILDEATSAPLSDDVFKYDMLHVNFGVAYWW